VDDVVEVGKNAFDDHFSEFVVVFATAKIYNDYSIEL
jgi:hypothetical protein